MEGFNSMDKDFLNLEDLAGLMEQLDEIETVEAPLTEEEKESQRRYEEIIKKHKDDVEA